MTHQGFRLAICGATTLLAMLGRQPSAQRDPRELFQRGLNALHQFEYEDAIEAFTQARGLDPNFALAYWGEAMTYHQTLWGHESVEAGRQALARLGPTAAVREAKARTPRDQGLLAAVDVLFGEGDQSARRQQYAEAMGRLHAREPEDPDVAAFYALALLGTMTRSLIGTAEAHEGHSQALAGSDTQKQVEEILGRILRAHPEHVGALHYLVHNDDDPGHARLALEAARTLTRLAPDSSHARHMPAHIFLQLGRWQEAAAADRGAVVASDAWIARKQLAPAMRNYHALAWLQYELLQLGRYREAKVTIDEIAPVVKTTGSVTLLSDLSSMRARYVIETASWPLLAAESNFGNAYELFAIGMSAARSRNQTLASRAHQALSERALDPREGDLRPAIAIMEKEVAAIISLAEGRPDQAVEALRAAVHAESRLPAPLGLPTPIKPAPELLGEVLVEIGRPAEAIPFFEAALKRHPNRSLSLLGLARATAAAGQAAASRRHYRALLANLAGADADVAALKEAQEKLGIRN